MLRGRTDHAITAVESAETALVEAWTSLEAVGEFPHELIRMLVNIDTSMSRVVRTFFVNRRAATSSHSGAARGSYGPSLASFARAYRNPGSGRRHG